MLTSTNCPVALPKGSRFRESRLLYVHDKYGRYPFGTVRAIFWLMVGEFLVSEWRFPMLAIHAERIGDLAVIECKGRVVRNEDVFKLRDAVRAQTGASIIALELSEIQAIGGGGLGMLAFLESWTRQHHIQFKLYDPSRAVIEGLVRNRSILNFEIAGFYEMMGILMRCETEQRMAA